MRDGSPQVDCNYKYNGSCTQVILGDPGDGTRAVEKSIFEGINVPVLQAMPLIKVLKVGKIQ